MKNYLILSLLFVAALMAGCKKDAVKIEGDQVGHSHVTHYPVLQMSGGQYVSVVQGTNFVEPGIHAYVDGVEVPVTTSGNLNTSQVGIYTVTYSASNKDNFSASVSRTVIVIPAHETPGSDLSGQYSYVGTGSYMSTVSKLSEGFYSTDNAWSAATVIPIVFISVDGATLTVPSQDAISGSSYYGSIVGRGTYNATTRRLVYTLSLPDQGISNSNRTWQRQ